MTASIAEPSVNDLGSLAKSIRGTYSTTTKEDITMAHISRMLPAGHPQAEHPGHDLLHQSYLSIDIRQTQDALDQLGDAMKSFGWDSIDQRFQRSEPRRCWRAWIGMAARLRAQSFDYIACGPLAHTTTEQELLNELEEIYVEATDARLAEILPGRTVIAAG